MLSVEGLIPLGQEWTSTAGIDDTCKKRIISSHCLGSDSRAAHLGYLWEKTEHKIYDLFACMLQIVTMALLVTCKGTSAEGHLHGVSSSRVLERLVPQTRAAAGRLWACSSCCLWAGEPVDAGWPHVWPAQHVGPCWGVSSCVPRSAGLGWEDSSAQLLCLSWGFSSLPHLNSTEGVVPMSPTFWPDSAPTNLCHGISCWVSIPGWSSVSLCSSRACIAWNRAIKHHDERFSSLSRGLSRRLCHLRVPEVSGRSRRSNCSSSGSGSPKPGAGLWNGGDGDEVRFSHCSCVRGEFGFQDTVLLSQDIM